MSYEKFEGEKSQKYCMVFKGKLQEYFNFILQSSIYCFCPRYSATFDQIGAFEFI